MKELNEKNIENVIIPLSNRFDDDLFQKTESELEKSWLFKWSDLESIEENAYQFHDMLELYGNVCSRWEEKHNGSCCLVERVRDKYLMPKIKQFVQQITSTITGREK